MQANAMPNLENLFDWFESEKRDLPWRRNPTSYHVWVSEVMLQQTQASVVIPYYERWIARFPTVKELAEAPLEEVIKLWEGLGYYSRARNLHEGAKWVVQNQSGELPQDPEQLAKIKGLGPYTIGAILSFAFHQKAVAVDGNVARVLSRLLLIEEEIDRPKVQKELREKLFKLLPDSKPWVIMEGLIELGAQVCTKKPRCTECPLQDQCLAFQLAREESLPLKSKRPPTTLLMRSVAVICHQGELLLRQEKEKRVMQGLYQFPYQEGSQVDFAAAFDLDLQFDRELPRVEHTFTRYRAHLFPSVWRAAVRKELEGYEWVGRERLKKLAFSSGHREIVHAYFTH